MTHASAPSRRTVLGLAAAGAATVPLLAACGSDDSEATTETTGEAVGTLQFFLSGDANQGGGFAKMAAKYKEETGTDVEIVDVANDDLGTKLKNAAQADDMPALARAGSIDPVWLPLCKDLSSVTEGSTIDPTLCATDTDGSVLSIATDLTAVGMFVNKDLFDAAGESVPTSADDVWTWDEFVASVKRVQEATGAQYGMAMDCSSHRLKAFLYEFGSDWFQPGDDGTYTTNEGTTAALEYFNSINDDSFMPRSVWLSGADGNALFKSGSMVAYMSGSWQIADFAVNITDFTWESVRLPKQPTRATNFGAAASISVFTGTGQEEAALAFVQWLYQPENYQELCEASGFLSVMSGIDITYTSNDDAFALYNEEIAACPPVVGEIFAQGLQYQLAGVATDGDPAKDETIKYLNGEQDVATAVQNILDLYTDQLGALPS